MQNYRKDRDNSKANEILQKENMQFKKRAMTEESNERWKNSMKKFKC
jgi:hypothetical protein